MIRTIWIISTMLLLFGYTQTVVAQGRLQAVRDNVNTPSTSASTDASNSNGASNDDEGGILAGLLGAVLAAQDDDGNSIGGMVFAGTFLAPFVGPALLLDDHYKYRLYFAPHPYRESYRGYQILSSTMAEEFYGDPEPGIRRKNWAARVLLENGNDFDGLNRVGVQVKIEHASRWGVVSNWNWFHEKLPCGCTDETVIGDTNLTFRFAQNEIASMYVGMGFRMLTDRRQTDFGFNFTYGGDWFPARPFVVSGAVDLGNLGSAGVFHARSSVGAIFRGWEFFGGYDFLRIGGFNLQGPMAGVRFWF